MDDYTGKKEGKYSNKRRKELNGFQPLVNEKKINTLHMMNQLK